MIDLRSTWNCSCHGVGMHILTVRHVELEMSIDPMTRVHMEAIVQPKEYGLIITATITAITAITAVADAW